MANLGGREEAHCVFVETNTDTRLALLLHNADTVSVFKENFCKEHKQSFPDLGEIRVSAVKVKRGNHYYHLPDSMMLSKVFKGISENWFVDVDVVKVVGSDLLTSKVVSRNELGVKEIANCSNLASEGSLQTNLDETKSNKRKQQSVATNSSRHDSCGKLRVEAVASESWDDHLKGGKEQALEHGEKASGAEGVQVKTKKSKKKKQSCYHLLSELTPHKSGWKVRVKVLRLWTTDWFSGKGLEMIICDEKETRLHATVLPNDFPVFKDRIKEGVWKIIQCFHVIEDFTFGLKCITSPVKIQFAPDTIVLPSDPVSDSLFLLPSRFFDIIGRVYEENELIDVVGVLHRMGDLREFQMKEDGFVFTNLRFELINPERDIIMPCVCRESLAREFYEQVKKNEAEHIVCALRFWVVAEGHGIDADSVVLSATSVSDFMLNPLDPEAEYVLRKYLAK